VSDHLFNDVVDGLTYCSRCGVWDGAAPFRPCHPRATTQRDQLVAAVIATGKRWWPSVSARAKHARMPTTELRLWQAIRELMKHDGEDVR